METETKLRSTAEAYRPSRGMAVQTERILEDKARDIDSGSICRQIEVSSLHYHKKAWRRRGVTLCPFQRSIPICNHSFQHPAHENIHVS